MREAREAKNLTLDDLQNLTKIQKRYLIGIEEGNYNVMPGKFYVRAFIKQYAEAVGLEAEQLFDEYKTDIPGTYNEDIPEQISRVRTRKQISTKSSKLVEMVPMILVIVFILGGLFAFWWFQKGNDVAESPKKEIESEQTQYDESNEDPPNNKKDEDVDDAVAGETDDTTDDTSGEDDEAVEEKPVQELVQTEKGSSTATYELKNAEAFMVELTAKVDGQAWVDVKNKKNHKFIYETIADGQMEKLDLTNETEVIFNIGRSSDLEVKINGEIFEYPFDPSKVVTQKITIRYTPAVTE
nr:RodZ domain-containing protein [Fredinandcohnia sp. SECRCQ15]